MMRVIIAVMAIVALAAVFLCIAITHVDAPVVSPETPTVDAPPNPRSIAAATDAGASSAAAHEERTEEPAPVAAKGAPASPDVTPNQDLAQDAIQASETPGEVDSNARPPSPEGLTGTVEGAVRCNGRPLSGGGAVRAGYQRANLGLDGLFRIEFVDIQEATLHVSATPGDGKPSWDLNIPLGVFLLLQ